MIQKLPVVKKNLYHNIQSSEIKVFISKMVSLGMAFTLVRGPGLLTALATRLAPLLSFSELLEIEIALSEIETALPEIETDMPDSEIEKWSGFQARRARFPSGQS